jgi:hypothetical protein
LDRLCDTRHETDCRDALLALIHKEPPGGGIDVAFWFMTDDWYRSALVNAHNRGVRVRILMDPRANASKAGNEAMLDRFKVAGIPMRYKVARDWSDILHWKMMFFEKGSGRPVVEFSAANYTPDSFKPFIPYQDYIDEVVYFTDDPRLTSTFATKFENYWTDTTGNFKDFANVTAPYPRYYPVVTQDPALNFPPTQDYAVKATTHYGREPAGVNGGKIDVIMYRMSDAKHATAIINAVNRGIPVRLITEQENYRDTRYIWHSYNADRMWAAGVDVKDHVGAKQGITHQKSVILYGQKEVIFGSSNWSSASSNQQLEHNIFSLPCAPGQVTWCDGARPDNVHKGQPAPLPPNWFFDYFVKQFEDKWNSVNPTGFVEFKPFRPLPGGTPVNIAPANGATGVGSTVVLKWDGGNWNHKYDVYIGLAPTLTEADKKTSDIIVGSPYTGDQESWTIPTTVPLQAGTTYFWRIVGKTMADSPRSVEAGINLTKSGPVWSFTTAGSSGGTTATPYPGAAPVLPARIEVENFDNGGPSVGYVDATAGNSGNAYRTSESVDIGPTSDEGGGHYVGWTKSGEWLQYSVDIPTAGTYTLNVRVANTVSGGTFRVEVNGQSHTLAVPPTGGYQNWQTVTKTGVALSAGAGQVVRLVMGNLASNGGVGNFNWLEFTTGAPPPPPPSAGPYLGTRVSLPAAVIEAENFDEGGAGIAYSDTTTGNNGGTYRNTNVDIGAKTGSGFYVGWTRPGEWLKYSVDVTTAGTYTLDVAVANKGAATTFHVEVDGANVTGPMAVPDTGDWQRWQFVSKPDIPLTPGPHEVRLVFAPGTTQNGGNVDYLRFQLTN